MPGFKIQTEITFKFILANNFFLNYRNPAGENMTKGLIVEKEIKIKAPVSKIWDMLTKAEWTKKYMFGCEPLTDWTAGSPILWRGASNGVVYVKGKILKIKPPELLQYSTFNANSELPDIPYNYLTVTLRLTEEDGYTK
jgi:uncharacterized protein YndB with AHSA1/START domain